MRVLAGLFCIGFSCPTRSCLGVEAYRSLLGSNVLGQKKAGARGRP